jgi:tRNA 2-thiouridine synthesizing protein A
MAKEEKISTVGMNCPKPLIETRKALRKLGKGQVLVVEGDHRVSKDEIPQAMKDTGEKVLSVEQKGPVWVITIRKG